MIVIPARATALVTPGGTTPSPLPQGVNQLKIPPPPEVIVSVLGCPSGVAFIYEVLYGTTFIFPCFWGGIEYQMFLTTNFFCFSFLEILREVWSSITPLVKLTVIEIFVGINMNGLLSRHSIHRRQHRRLI